jgi:MFS family permease
VPATTPTPLRDEPALPREGAATTAGWWAVAVLTLANISGFIDRMILSLLVAPLKRDLGLTDTQVSLLMGFAFVASSTTLAIPLARLADRTSRRLVLSAGIAFWSVMTALSGLAQSYGQLMAARVGVGVGEAALQAPAVSLITALFPRRTLGRALSVYTLGTFLGSGLAYVIGGRIVAAVSGADAWIVPLVGAVRPWQVVFLAIGAPGLVIAALLLTVREPRGARASSDAGSLRALWSWAVAQRTALALVSLGFAASATVNYAIAGWLATHLQRSFGWDVARAGFVQGSLTMTIGVAGVLLGGWLTDRLTARGRRDAPLITGIIGATGMLLFAGSYPLVRTPAIVVVLLALVNLFAAFPWGAASAAAATLVPSALRAQGVALFFVVVNLISGIVGPTSVALVTDYVFRDVNALRYALSAVTVTGMVLAIVLLLVARPHFVRAGAHAD